MALVGRIRVESAPDIPDIPEDLWYRVLEIRCLLCGHKGERLYLTARKRVLVSCNCYAPENIQPVRIIP